MLVQVARAAARYSGLVAILRRFGSGVPILCYHNVVGPAALGFGDPGTHMPVDEFIRQMEWVRRRYQVLPLDELMSRPPENRRGRIAAITFDDGYAGALQHAIPVLKALDLPATFFILGEAPSTRTGFWWDDPAVVRHITPELKGSWLTDLAGDRNRILAGVSGTRDPAERPDELLPASWDAIGRAVSEPLFTIGAHSMTHRALPAIDRTALVHELTASRDAITQRLKTVPQTFAYPYGSWNQLVRDSAREVGYRAAFTLADRPVRPGDSSWGIPRICVPAGLPLDALANWLVDLRPRRPEPFAY